MKKLNRKGNNRKGGKIRKENKPTNQKIQTRKGKNHGSKRRNNVLHKGKTVARAWDKGGGSTNLGGRAPSGRA